MAFTIEERFEVKAPLERVWAYLIDPARVVVCLPGAELLELQEDNKFLGAIKVKVGPLSMSYKGSGRFTEINEQLHQVRMVGEAREVGGSGSAKVNMVSTLTQLEMGVVQIVVSAEVNLVGKIVQFGRGMIEEVSKQLFRQFSSCVKQHLELPEETATEQPSAGTANGPVAAEPLGSSAEPQVRVSSEARVTHDVQPVRVAPLAFRAFWAMIARFFKRLFGSKSEI